MKPKLRPIRDQVVVLVGATSGIGLETALLLVEKDARVVIVGRSQEGLNDALERVRSHAEAHRIARMHGSNGKNLYAQSSTIANMEAGGAPVAQLEDQIISMEGDVTDFEQMRSVADQVMQRFGRINTWVNIAAVSEWALFEDTNPDEFRRIIEVNLVGQAFGAMAALPHLRQQRGGALIFVSSMAGRVPIPYQSAYNASKAGLIQLADTLRQELRHTGAPVSVSTILPASMNTPLFDKARTKIGVEPKPIPPVYDTNMVARAIIHAASHPVRELIVGDAGYMATFMKRLAPTLTNNYMGRSGFRKQRSDEPKSAQAPDNLYEHISGYDQVEGDYQQKESRVAPLTWMSTHPRLRMAIVAGLMAGVGGLIGWQIVKSRQRKRSWRYRLPRQIRSFSKDAKKATGKAIDRASEQVSQMPVFHQKGFLEELSDTLSDWWTSILAFLPFAEKKSLGNRISDRLPDLKRKKSLGKRISDRLPDVNLPWQNESFVQEQGKKMKKRLDKTSHTVSKRLDKASDRVNKRIDKASDKVRDRFEKTSGKARDRFEKTSDKVRNRIEDRRHQASKAFNRAMERANEMKDERPEVERRETVYEKITYRK